MGLMEIVHTALCQKISGNVLIKEFDKIAEFDKYIIESVEKDMLDGNYHIVEITCKEKSDNGILMVRSYSRRELI